MPPLCTAEPWFRGLTFDLGRGGKRPHDRRCGAIRSSFCSSCEGKPSYVFSVQDVSRASCPCGDGSPVVISDSCATGRIHSHQLSAKTVRCVAADSLYTGKMPVIRLSRVYTAKHIPSPVRDVLTKWVQRDSSRSGRTGEGAGPTLGDFFVGEIYWFRQTLTFVWSISLKRRLSATPSRGSIASGSTSSSGRRAKARSSRWALCMLSCSTS